MEFNEKLQQLRKQKDLTQEQLAEKLFVSRTAISKWESGKGYPNIESLKSISRLFEVSIDDLLSGEELLDLANDENRTNMGKIFGMFYGIIDLMAMVFIFLPFYGQTEGVRVQAVTLLSYDKCPFDLRVAYFAVLVFMAILGVVELIIINGEDEKKRCVLQRISLGLQSFAILLFAISRQPYVTAFLFLLFIVKILIVIKSIQIK